ncbi:MAG: hypothetical protein U0R80_07995 [Nocardioidaceae bacterium]
MMVDRIPTDSTDARELREAEAEHEAQQAEARRVHDLECVDGWRGEDEHGRPRACLTCRPWLARRECRVCRLPADRCAEQRQRGRGRCCDTCAHPSEAGS